jgi:hypothetical protein
MAKPTRILFIGNSFTRRNDLPGMIARLAEAGKPKRVVETEQIIANGMALKAHWNRGEAREAIKRGKWDFVSLQEQSTLPLKNPARMHESVRLFIEEIRAARAEPVLYMTWVRTSAPQRQDELADAFLSIGKELMVRVAPVGLAWKEAFARVPGLVLHDKDGSHPNPLGTYLGACVFYATLFGASPVGLPGDVSLGKELDSGRILTLQEIAWRVAEKISRT